MKRAYTSIRIATVGSDQDVTTAPAMLSGFILQADGINACSVILSDGATTNTGNYRAEARAAAGSTVPVMFGCEIPFTTKVVAKLTGTGATLYAFVRML